MTDEQRKQAYANIAYIYFELMLTQIALGTMVLYIGAPKWAAGAVLVAALLNAVRAINVVLQGVAALRAGRKDGTE